MSIYHDFEAIKSVALHYAEDHNCNYNVIVCRPLNGEFNQAYGSTYEFVVDSYFVNHPDALVVFKTDDELKPKEALTPDKPGMSQMLLKVNEYMTFDDVPLKVHQPAVFDKPVKFYDHFYNAGGRRR